MGDYSRDTFQLTNVLHQFARAQPVLEPRHYVGVRQQQGVPLLDADWNELEDIRRLESELQNRAFYGDGIPAGDTGFRISAVSDSNDFAIAGGMALVEGRLVFNALNNLSYTGQALQFGITLPALSTSLVPERNDLVYLDVWEEEIGAVGVARVDERLTNPMIGIETCRRLERRWLVRVLEDADSLADIVREDGHAYLALARLRRSNGQGVITDSRIYDLRRTDLNVAEYLKVPVNVQRAGQSLDSDSFANVLDNLRAIYLLRLEQNRFFIDSTDLLGHTMIVVALQHVMQLCSTGGLQARTFNLTNRDASTVLQQLLGAQRATITAIANHGLGGVAQDDFLAGYDAQLDTAELAIDADLLEGAQAQEVVNAWLAADVNGLPEGNVTVVFLALDPAEPLQSTRSYDVFVEINSGVTSALTDEIFDVTASLSSAPWSVVPTMREVSVTNGGSTVVVFTVNVPNELVVGGSEADFTVVARARRNPSIVSTALPLHLEVGVQPITGGVLQYAGPALVDGRLQCPNGPLTSTGLQFNCNLNNADGAPHDYTVEWSLALAGGADETNWFPLAGAPQNAIINVAAEASAPVVINFGGPAGGDVTGTEGTITIRIVAIDAVAEADPETLNIDFIVV